ncbi:TonB-dependent receptor [Neolewinella lacunae]|uniref:TonB-dependent receptor n=1 Tax=Neolewinella lacunae TaxID=1517758 RepID=A0A923PKY5_9BACT|nr:TonB-dependent receptor [Neolewinella lacunae]MBC6994611.1 TonB-dependent receptor [Neolewinella lacunae]MDN3634483.1 TonB-dependent receptor [Neolewinella lacunae]
MNTRTLGLTGFLFVFAMTLLGQTGSITGVVTDADQGVGLPGASIFLKDAPSVGTVTELDGTFVLSGVPVGNQTVVISFVGFAPEERELTVVANQAVELNLILGGQVIMGQEILVTAQAIGQAKAINQQLNSDAIANFVSADKIKELPDVNAAEAISRLPGVAINRDGGEGSKIVVRGLDPKFTAININGVRLPSTSGTDRSVDLSLISPELLSGIELFKSPTPDMDGDALGGTVNLNILKADDRPRGSLKALGGYNDLVGEYKDYKVTGSLSRRIFNNKLGVIATANVERFNRSGQTVGQAWGDKREVILDTMLNIFDQEANALTFSSRREIRRRYNGSLGFDYAFGKSTDVTVLGIYSRTSRDQFNHSERYDINNTGVQFNPAITESAIDLYSASVSTRHKLNVLNIEWGVSYSEVLGETPLNIGFDFVGAGINFLPGALDDRTDPSLIYNFLDISPDRTYLTGANSAVTSNSEDITTAFVDLSLPFNLGDKARATFKFGGKYRVNNKERSFAEYYDKLFYLRQNSTWNELNGNAVGAPGIDPSGQTYLGVSNFTTQGQLDITDNYQRDVNLTYAFDEGLLRRFNELFSATYPQDFLSVTNNYGLTEKVAAGYAMLKVNVGSQLTIIPGFRYEANDNVYNGIYADLSGDWGESGVRDPRTATNKYGVFLPHLHLKYKPVEWFDVRASYSTTLARPDFNYLVPATLVNRNGNLTVDRGNPALNPSVSTNYDLYLTAFSGKYGLFSIGGFYKDIQDAFYPLILGVNNDSIAVANGLPATGFIGAELTTFESSPASRVYGVEFDVQSSLSFLPKPFNGLVVNLNYARLYSNTTINSFREETECVIVRGRPRCTTSAFGYQREVALIGQASDIFNASLGYDAGGFSARVSAAYQGTKLTGYSSIADKDRFDQSFWRMDAALKYRFSRRFNVFLNLNNLTNQQDITFFRQERFETSRASFGTTATAGVEVKFLPREER